MGPILPFLPPDAITFWQNDQGIFSYLLTHLTPKKESGQLDCLVQSFEQDSY